MKPLSITIASAAILAAASFGANAQTPPEKQENAPSTSRQAPGGEGGQRSQSAKPEQGGGREAQGGGMEQPKPGEKADRGAIEKSGGQQQGAAEKPADMNKAGRADADKPDANKNTADGRKPGEDGKSDASKADASKPDGSKSADQQRGGDRDNKSADKQGGGDRPEKQATKEFKPEQKTVIKETIVREKIRPEKINVQIRVGVAVPRTVHLHPLPPTIIEVYPAYRSYKLVMVDEGTLLVIDPVTWEIVDVIEV